MGGARNKVSKCRILHFKIKLFHDIFKQNLRILVKFAETPGIFNEQVVCVQGFGVEKLRFSNLGIPKYQSTRNFMLISKMYTYVP